MSLRLTLACNDYDRCRALIDGTVKPDGITLDITKLKPRELFPRMLDHQEFDVAELSLASYATLVARDASPFVAIPVMLSKLFRHSCIYVRKGAGIETAAGSERQTRRHHAIRRDRNRLHQGHAERRIRHQARRPALVHRRLEHADRTAARAAQSPGQDRAPVP